MLAETALLPPVIRMAASPRVGRWLTQHSRWFLNLLVSQGAAHGLAADVREGYLHPYPTRQPDGDLGLRPRHPLQGFASEPCRDEGDGSGPAAPGREACEADLGDA